MVAGNLSRNTNVVKKESIVSKRPKDQEEIIWANERSSNPRLQFPSTDTVFVKVVPVHLDDVQ